MSRIEQFNAASSEKVLQEKPNQNGEDFNLLYGHTAILPGTLATAQGSNGIDTPEGTNKLNLSEPVNPHGVLVRNSDAYTTRAPYIVNGVIKQGLVSVINVATARQDAWIGNNVFGKPTFGEPEVNITSYPTTRDSLSFPTNQNLHANDLIPSVGSRFFRS